MEEKLLKCFQEKKNWTLNELDKRCKPKSSKDFTLMIKILNELEEKRIIFNNHNVYTYIDPSCEFIGKANDISRFEFLVSVDERKIRVDKKNAKNVFDQDEVLVYEEAHQNKIVHVFSHGITKIIGTFYQRKKDFYFRSDVDFHKSIKIKNVKDFKIRNKDKAVLEILKHGDPIICKIKEIIGKEDDKGVDITSMLYENNVRTTFSKHVSKEVNNLPKKVTKEDLVGRVDYRNLLTVTIDGDDARDFDDAISVEKTENGYRLYVHIADVTHYVKKNSAIDKEAYIRSTSIYLVDRVVPMLPFELSNGICSLNPDVDRCTLTCRMDIDNTGRCVSYKIEPTVIHSDKRCTYAKVNRFLNGERIIEYDDISTMLIDLYDLSKLLEARSIERGTIDFNTKESKITLNKNGKPVKIEIKSRGYSEQMIEECMILANVCVANFLNSNHLPGMYRIHEKPDSKKIYTLCSVADALNEQVTFDPNEVEAKDIQEFLHSITNEQSKEILSIVALRAMQKARYDVDCIGHYGLALEEYCHFTSPIRRYSDLVVHRMLRKYLFVKSSDDPKLDMEAIAKQSIHVSQKERDAISVERQVDDYEKALYMSNKIGKKFEGTIVGVQSFGFFVELDDTVEGLVPSRSLYHDFFDYDEDRMCLVGQTYGDTYQIGQKVKVVCVEADAIKGQVTFALS